MAQIPKKDALQPLLDLKVRAEVSGTDLHKQIPPELIQVIPKYVEPGIVAQLRAQADSEVAAT